MVIRDQSVSPCFVNHQINTIRIHKGGLKAEEIFKKSNKMEAFPYFFLLFGKAP